MNTNDLVNPFHTLTYDVMWISQDSDNPADPLGIEPWALSAPSIPESAIPLGQMLAVILEHLTVWNERDLGTWSAAMEQARNELGRLYMVIAGKQMRCLGIDHPAVEAVR